ncbi:restriction endonuclease-like protein [Mesobacillus jeotgali]|uniref:Restriction endonuclease-like protein n=1 Tax=Mesobacillus jeotgali TaxID=129985 RepID=A0ABY9VQ26_9BACI|nr:restriction endonuclease-like protein [Mesobacillus jeotgali]WNF24846.1 restriction endonuclease-like protein [Mesobacillus jeotgali]
MALLPSGSREDVELVKIETKDLSLVIKGKPYHERYEGLRQYKAMDRHDVMYFNAVSDSIQDEKIYDISVQELVNPTIQRPIFFENGVYQLIVVPKDDRKFTFYHEYPLIRQAVSLVPIGSQSILMGNLQFQNEVGFTTFEIRADGKTILEITLEIFPVKLDYKMDYQKLLEEVNDEIYNLAFHFIRKTYLGARLKLEGNPSKAEFYRLISEHFNQFLQAIARIEFQPHHKLEKTYEKARGDQLRKQDSVSRNFLRKRANVFVDVSKGIDIRGRTVMPSEGLKIKKELTYDTLENRYVKWMIERIKQKLDDLLDSIVSKNRWTREKPDYDLVEKIESMSKQLKSKLSSPFWKPIGKLDRSVMSLVLQMAPGYRDAFQIYLTLSKGLMLQGKLYRMSVKDVATLYEYWTFLKLGQILDRKYKLISQDIVQVNREGLFINLEANKTARRIFKHPVTNEEIILAYQKRETSLPTVSQIPDTMLSIEKKGKGYRYHYIFDAKYRIDYAQEDSYYQKRYKTPGPMEDDINTMHRYRDSIVATSGGPFERTAFGAYVLFPWFDETVYEEHHFYKSIDKVNIGALPFLPNATNMVERFVERLIDKSPEEIQKEGILPRGAHEEWKSSLDQMVMVGLVSDQESYDQFSKEAYYQIPVNQLRKGWQEAEYIALYVKNSLNTDNGVQLYAKIKDVRPYHDGNDEYMRFHAAHWSRLKQNIRPVNYGISSYVMTTLSTLKEAQELPELFMKSKEEMTIWRMLRRVSDQIRIDLDHENLDRASRITEYKIKDIKVMMDKQEREILFIQNDAEEAVSIDQLEKNPSGVFKKLMEMLQQSKAD